VSPTTADHVRTGLGRKIRYILDGGPARIGLESTIVDVRDPQRPRLLRPGGVSHRELVRALGRPVARPRRTPSAAAPQVAPGQLPRHYSPRTPVTLHPRLADRAGTGAKRNEAWLFLRRPRHARGENIFWLDPKGDLPGVARRLFAVLRRLDAAGFAAIHVERAHGTGLAEAINDRLRRAAAR
jgi:L-threonylcarbamoyladenylate synthase